MQNAANKNSSDLLKPTIGAFLIAFVVYAFTAARTVTFEDSGLFLVTGYFWGIPHPPGYPLYTLLSHIFSMLPIGDSPAFRMTLVSVLFGAGAVGAAEYSLRHLFKVGWRISAPAALVLGFSATFWSQAVVAEVYALHIFLALLFLALVLKMRHHQSVGRFFILGLVGALAMSNHWPLFVLGAPGYLFLIERSWLKKKFFAAFGLGLSLFVVPYLMMWWRSGQNPEVSFLGEIVSLKDLVHYFTRKYYALSDTSVLHSWRDTVRFYFDFLHRLAYRDFLLFTFPVGAFGLYSMIKDKSSRRTLGSLLYFLLATPVFLPFLIGLEFNDLNQNVFLVFWLMPFAAWTAFILNGALKIESHRTLLGGAFLTIFAVLQLVGFWRVNDLSQDHFAEDYARVVLESIPQGQVLVASTDGDVGPIAYMHLVAGVNPGAKLYTGSGVFFKNRIFSPFTPGVERRFKSTVAFIQENSPVNSVKNLIVLDGQKEIPVSFTFNGVTYRYTKFQEAKVDFSDAVLELTKKALDHFSSELDLNNWPYHRGVLAARLCNILVLRNIEDHEVFEKSPECQQVLARHFVATSRREMADVYFLRWLNSLRSPGLREKQQFVYHFFVNRLEIVNAIKGQSEKQQSLIKEALLYAEKTIFEYPLCDNVVYPVLDSIKTQIALSPEALNQLSVFAKCKK